MAAPHLLVENNPHRAANHITFPITHSRAAAGHNFFKLGTRGSAARFRMTDLG
jgi:hypothetical protein